MLVILEIKGIEAQIGKVTHLRAIQQAGVIAKLPDVQKHPDVHLVLFCFLFHMISLGSPCHD